MPVLSWLVSVLLTVKAIYVSFFWGWTKWCPRTLHHVLHVHVSRDVLRISLCIAIWNLDYLISDLLCIEYKSLGKIFMVK